MTQQDTAPPIASLPPAHAHKLFVRGMAVSVAYVMALLIYAWLMRKAMLEMKPDQFATFLSGVFAPLAFLWLVLGFRQQGDELQNSARALWLQGEELRNSVEQQRQLVEVSREQLAFEAGERRRAEEEAERAAQPRLHMPRTGGSYSGPLQTLKLAVTSGGPACSDVRVFVDGNEKVLTAILSEGERMVTAQSYGRPEDVEPLMVEVEYTDIRGNRRAQRFAVPVDESGGPNGGRTLGQPVKLPGVEKRTPSVASDGSGDAT
ncbi:MAG: hypothetical protein ABIO86_03045 [Sphingomonas sp.]